MRNVLHTITVGLSMLFVMPAFGQFYQGHDMPFGKNRVQYKEFLWSYYRFDRYEIYFYEGGRPNAIYLSQVLDKHIEDVETKFDFFINDKIQFIIYNTHSDFKQSNIGITSDESTNIGGTSRIVGSKVFLYFGGDHELFEEQVRSGISQIIINQMMYGSSWKEVIKNSTLLTVPDWYLNGIISYVTDPDDQYVFDRVKDAIVADRYRRFNILTGTEATYAGHSLWKFIADVYGENIIPNILYMTRMSRNVETGFLYVLGIPFKEVLNQYQTYYRSLFDKDTQLRTPPVAEAIPVKTKKNRIYQYFKLSSDERHAAYVSNENGQYRVFIYDLQTHKRKKIFKAEHKLERVPDLSYPTIAWHPTGEQLSFVIEKRDRLFLMMYNLDDKKLTRQEIFMVDKVFEFAYSPDGQKIVLSGQRNGQSDIYVYYLLGSRTEQITNDIYDDRYPSFAERDRKIVFSSNRKNDTLNLDQPFAALPYNNDIFVYDLMRRNPVLERITNTPGSDETHPFEFSQGEYSFLSNQNGINNRFIALYDSTIARIDTVIHYRYFSNTYALTNVSRDILYYDYQPFTKEYAFLTVECGKFRFYKGYTENDKPIPTDELPLSVLLSRPSRNGRENVSPQNPIESLTMEEKSDNIEKGTSGVDIVNKNGVTYTKEVYRIDEFKDVAAVAPAEAEPTASSKEFVGSNLPSQRNYNVNFATDYVITQIDNTFNSQFYQNFVGPGALYPGLSVNLQYGMSDLFEDYRLVGGVRFGFNLQNNNYLVAYENLKRRLDKRITFERQVQEGGFQNSRVKIKSHQLAYEVRYPLSEIDRFELRLFYRLDNQTVLATDAFTLELPDIWVNTFGGKLAYVYDNTISRGLNLYNGWRFKIWGEYYFEPNVQVDQSNYSPISDGSGITVVGFDFRHYLKIHRDIILAMRFAGNKSFGNRNIIHFLGGVDNWLFGRRIDDSTPIDFTQNYFYQASATPLRGFFIGARNGSTMAVANAELRWPIFKYFINAPIKSDFIKNFQLIGFGDIGSAWNGLHPYSDENRFNEQTITQNPITVVIDSNREPIIYGYGFGLRSRLLGYFMRADWAWGVDDGVVLPAVFYFSLSLDF
jgi:Tol biopolymer transport system component